MPTPTVDLVRPDVAHHAAWLAMAREHDSAHLDGGGLGERTVAELADPAVFAAWVDDVLALERGERVPEGMVAATLRWVGRGGTLLGTIQLRHELNGFLLEQGGHVGYAVRPSARRQGVARWALAAVLDVARVRGIDPVLVTCDEANTGSRRTIEGAGGVLEDVRAGKRRYWVATTAAPGPADDG